MIDIRKMTLPDILKDIQSILEKDCAAAELLPRDHTADIFLRAVSTMEEMHMLEDRAFHNFVQVFVSSRKLPCVSFYMTDGGDFRNYWRGIAVRERGGVLYVTDAIPESGLKRGDRIVGLNRQDPAVFYNRNIMRPEDSPLAGDENWQAFLNHGILASVVHTDGSEEPEKIRFSECYWGGRDPWEDPTQSFGEEAIQPKVERLPSGTLYMRLPNFGDEEEIEGAVLEMRVKRGNAATLILDLRGCRGGSPEYLQPLLPYLCDGPMNRDEFFGKVRELTRFTERNCELFREQMQPFLTGTDEDLKEILEARNPTSMSICTLMDKPERRVADIKADYVCFEVPDAFVVGYGLDYAQKYRNLPYIGVLRPESLENG